MKVDIDPQAMVGADGTMANDHVVGSIHYPDSTTRGVIVYARAALIEGAPADVKAYAARDPAFPNDPTFDQLYTDQRFDVYRRLGRFTADCACATMSARGVPEGSRSRLRRRRRGVTRRGGGDGDRTHYLLHAMQALYQLSYAPVGKPRYQPGRATLGR